MLNKSKTVDVLIQKIQISILFTITPTGHVLSVHNLNGQAWLVVINAMIGITGYVCQTYQMFLENPKPGPVTTVF